MDCSLILLSAMVLTSLHFPFLHYRIIGDNKHRGTGLKDTIMQFWKLRRNKLIHDYSLVGYILSPNPTNMEHVVDNIHWRMMRLLSDLSQNSFSTQAWLATLGLWKGQNLLTTSWRSMVTSPTGVICLQGTIFGSLMQTTP